MLSRKLVNIVILNGTKWSEESLAHKGLRFYPGAPGLRMTSIRFSTGQKFMLKITYFTVFFVDGWGIVC